MISLLEDIQNRLDAGGVIVKFNKPRSPNGRVLLEGLYLFGSEHTEGSPGIELDARQRRVHFKYLIRLGVLWKFFRRSH